MEYWPQNPLSCSNMFSVNQALGRHLPGSQFYLGDIHLPLPFTLLENLPWNDSTPGTNSSLDESPWEFFKSQISGMWLQTGCLYWIRQAKNKNPKHKKCLIMEETEYSNELCFMENLSAYSHWMTSSAIDHLRRRESFLKWNDRVKRKKITQDALKAVVCFLDATNSRLSIIPSSWRRVWGIRTPPSPPPLSQGLLLHHCPVYIPLSSGATLSWCPPSPPLWSPDTL